MVMNRPWYWEYPSEILAGRKVWTVTLTHQRLVVITILDMICISTCYEKKRVEDSISNQADLGVRAISCVPRLRYIRTYKAYHLKTK